MNGDPSAAQKRFHDELREMYFEKYAGRGELHHVFGSKWKAKVYGEDGLIKKPGEWIVILLTPETHKAIKDFSFEAERGMFRAQQREYERYFNKPYPVPVELIEAYKSMRSRLDVVKQ